MRDEHVVPKRTPKPCEQNEVATDGQEERSFVLLPPRVRPAWLDDIYFYCGGDNKIKAFFFQLFFLSFSARLLLSLGIKFISHGSMSSTISRVLVISLSLFFYYFGLEGKQNEKRVLWGGLRRHAWHFDREWVAGNTRWRGGGAIWIGWVPHRVLFCFI